MITANATTATRTIGLLLGTALLASCAGKTAAPAALSAAQAEAAIAKGKGDKAVALAEAAVLADPHSAETRKLLGAAYIEAGRFASAAQALGDAMQLGDTSGRTVLSYSLTLSALGRYAEAQTLLARYERNLSPADYGLAITLAGSPQQGIETLSNALRYGENTPKLRQNLAYAFALKGDWRSARLIASQDLGADKLDARLSEWAQMAMPEMAIQRIAALLGVNARSDTGQPAELALANFKTTEQLGAEALAQDTTSAPVATPDTGAELVAAEPFELAPSAPAPAAVAQVESEASAPVALARVALPPAKPAKARPVAAKPSAAFETAFARKPGAYSVQLGSYSSLAVANDAWSRFQKRHSELKGADRVVTKAVVSGKTFYRVAAAGFARDSAASFCAGVRKSGGGCLAYATARVLPGATKGETRVAAR